MKNFIKSFFGLNRYVSALDQFLKSYNHHHPLLSLSQRQEKEKYAKIYRLRDNATIKQTGTKNTLISWDKF